MEQQVATLFAIPLMAILLTSLFTIITSTFWIWMIYNCATKIPSGDKDKIIWIIIILFLHWVGALIYFIARKPRKKIRSNPPKEQKIKFTSPPPAQPSQTIIDNSKWMPPELKKENGKSNIPPVQQKSKAAKVLDLKTGKNELDDDDTRWMHPDMRKQLRSEQEG